MEKYIEAFIELCIKVFNTMGGIKIAASKPFIMNRDAPHNWDISTVIGLSGDARGAVALAMNNATVLHIAGVLSGTEYKEVNRDVIDIVGEIINIIAGQAKQRMEGEYTLEISLPTVLCGLGHQLSWPGRNSRIICVPFKIFDKEEFHFFATLEPKAL